MSIPLPGSWPSPRAVTITTMLLLATTTLAHPMPPASSGSPSTNSPSLWSTIVRERKQMVVVAAVAAAAVLVLVLVLKYCLYRRNRRMQFHSASPSLPLSSSKRNFGLEQVRELTNDFSEAYLLGEGGFGRVYHGALSPGVYVAVKRLEVGSQQGEPMFLTEVEILSRVHHRNVVSLVGYCTEGSERALVYKLVPNGSLESNLRGGVHPTLTWEARMRVAVGSAKALAYLHEDCHPTIIHHDIKSANILIDSDFEAKVADFGLAKSASESNQRESTLVGTPGYIAPEYASSGELTPNFDTFSFGVVLLELITGRRPVGSADHSVNDFFVDSMRPQLKEALKDAKFDSLVDHRLQYHYSHSQVTRMVACAAACLHESPQLRPRMSVIARVLEGYQSASDLIDGTVARPNNLDLEYNNSNCRQPAGEYGSYACGSSGAGPSRQTARDLETGRMELAFRDLE